MDPTGPALAIDETAQRHLLEMQRHLHAIGERAARMQALLEELDRLRPGRLPGGN